MSRQHHYAFGHVALRQIFFERPHKFVATLVERGDELLPVIWQDVGERVQEFNPESEILPADGLACVGFEISETVQAVIVTLPEPEEVTEAHFVALVTQVPQKQMWGLLGSKGWSRYITLEYGHNSDLNQPRTVLCEWTQDSHANMGDGPAATVREFRREIERLVESRE